MENKEEQSKLYEGMYVISPVLSEDARQKALEKIRSGIETRKGEIVKIHDQGRRKLAYEIEGHREGYYYLLYFKAPAPAIGELWQEYHLNEDLLRFITLRTETVLEKVEFKSLAQQQ
ncbi:MAG: rpsF [Chlamydiales bacterium]|jgi:small subunit ribosomal protein S6|nr:rpsF [Chlamydiales bacterium]